MFLKISRIPHTVLCHKGAERKSLCLGAKYSFALGSFYYNAINYNLFISQKACRQNDGKDERSKTTNYSSL
jgi:hypothetical protein